MGNPVAFGAVEETQVNTSDSATIAGGSNNQQTSHSAALASGGYVVVFEDESRDENSGNVGLGSTRILAQRYNADGSKDGGEILISNLPDDQRLPNVAGHPDGGFIVVAQDFDAINDRDVEIRRYDASGLQTSSTSIQSNSDETDPAVEVFGDGSYAVIYALDTTVGAVNSDVVARIYTNNNTELSGGPFVLGNLNGDEVAPNAVQLSNGNIAVAYQEEFSSTDNDPNFAILSSDGTAIATNGSISSDLADETEVSIAALTNDNFLVVFTSAGEDIQFSIRGNDGSLVLGLTNADMISGGNQTDPQIVGLPDGGFLITFFDGLFGAIFGQRFDAEGNFIGDRFNVSSRDSGIISNDSLTLLNDGRVAYTYTVDTFLSSNNDIRTGILEIQPADFSLSQINGANGFTINGVDVDDSSGISVSSAGDVNGDGIDDLIIGAFNADPLGVSDAGESYVVFGSISGFGSNFDLSSLNGTNGFVINGISEDDISGTSVSSAGDINGDGFDDIIIGASGGDPSGNINAGESYVVFGSGSGFNSSINLSALNGTNGFVVNGINQFDISGVSVSSAGDINGDGFDDIIVGASGGDTAGNFNAGESYVVFGSNLGFGANLNLSQLNGANGFVINGISLLDRSGLSISSAGDFNGDGFDDIIIGAPNVSLNSDQNVGQSYVVFGSNTGFGSSFNLSTLDGTNGFAINGINSSDLSGISVSGAGDVNGDGFDDVIIGASGFDADNVIDAGQNYVVFGSDSSFNASFDLSSLDGTNGFSITGFSPFSLNGASVSGAGDFNGDGFDDILIGAQFTNINGGSNVGQSYLVFGRATGNIGVQTDVDLSALSGVNGFSITGLFLSDRSGTSVSAAGDVNGDGFDDIIIGAQTADGNDISNSGQSYVLFGAPQGFSTNITGGNADQIIHGSVFDDVLAGNVGNDTIFGGGGGDFIDGGEGEDTAVFTGNFSDHSVSFGFGLLSVINQLAITGFNFLSGVERIQFDDRVFDVSTGTSDVDGIFGDANDDLIFGAADNDFILGAAGNDVLFGGSDADFINGGSGIDELNGNLGIDFLAGGLDGDVIFGGGDGDTIFGEGGVDILNGDEGVDIIFGGTEGDVINGGADGDRLFGQTGSDSIMGDDGVDLIFGEEGNDFLSGGAEDDVLFGGNGGVLANDGDDTLEGNDGGDLLFGGAGGDGLFGGTGSDSLFGEEGDDILSGGADLDALVGGVGEDVFVFTSGFGNDFIIDFEDNVDTINLAGLGLLDANAALASGTAFQATNGVFFTFNGGADTLMVFGNTLSVGDLVDDIVV